MRALKIKNIKLWVLCSIVLVFLLISCLYEPLLSKFLTIRVEKTMINGEVKYPPFTPLEVLPFGTDIIGFTIFAKIIQGFKYTFFIGLLLSIAQIFSSLVINMLTLHKLGSKVLLPIFSYFDKLFTLIPKPFLLLLLIGPYSDALLFNTDNVQPSANLKFVMIQLFIIYQQTNGDYTLKLISASLAITLFSLIIYSYYFPKMKNKKVMRLIKYLEDIESLPVLGIVFFVHWLSVVIYKETSIYLFKTVGTPREPAITVPLVILSIFPIIFLIKYMTPYIKFERVMDTLFYTISCVNLLTA